MNENIINNSSGGFHQNTVYFTDLPENLLHIKLEFASGLSGKRATREERH